MLFENDVKRALGVKPMQMGKMTEAIKLWKAMYDGEAYWIGGKAKSLNLPSAIASETARLVTMEMKSNIRGGVRAEYLEEQYQGVVENLRGFVEYGCASGGLILKPFVSGRKILVDFAQAGDFLPVEFDSSGRITGAVFVDRVYEEDKVYTRLEYHRMDKGEYEIRNVAYCSKNRASLGKEIALEQVEKWENLTAQVRMKNVEQPLFAYFKMPVANTVDSESPLGVSIYARAVELIEEADRQYSRLIWEFESGERALYVSDTAFRRDKSGNIRFPDKRLYRAIDGAPELFEDWTPTIREQSILNGLDNILMKVEDSCGLARGTFSNPQTEVRTATELKIMRQRSYATVVDTQKALKRALEDLIGAMNIWVDLYQLAPDGIYEVSFEFDDSIASDRQAEFAERQQLLTMGVLQPWEMRAWYLGEDEQTAREQAGAGCKEEEQSSENNQVAK